METESSVRNVVFLNKDRTVHNLQKHYICINVASSETFRSHLHYYVQIQVQGADKSLAL
jgi:hypothetical protein